MARKPKAAATPMVAGTVVSQETNEVVHSYFKRRALSIPDMSSAMAYSLVVNHVVTDRRAGSTGVEEICGPTANLQVIAEAMKEEGVRQDVSRFFLDGRVVKIIEDNIPVSTLKAGEAVASRDKLIKSVNTVAPSSAAGVVIREFVIALAYQTGIINETTKITQAMAYPAMPVTISEISLDLVAQNAVRTAESIKVRMTNKEKMSRESFARSFAEALTPVGQDLHRAVTVQHVFDDIVKAIRVRLLRGYEYENLGSIEEEWLNNPVVDELMTNWTFIQAALSLPATSNIGTKNNTWVLAKDAPLAIASLKSSSRYAILGKDEYLRTYGKVTVCAPDGAPVYFVGWREASIQPVAQNVSKFKDVLMPNIAVNIIPGPDAVSKFVASAAPRGEGSKIGDHVNQLLSMVEHLAEANDPRTFWNKAVVTGDNIGESFVFGEDGLGFTQELGVFLADRLYLSKREETDSGYGVTYVVNTKFKYFRELDWTVSLNAAGEFYTDSLGMVLLLTDDFAPKAEVEPRSQLLSDKAMYTRVTNLDTEGRLVESGQRLSFKVKLSDREYSGSLLTSDAGMQDLPEDSFFVVPLHNQMVVNTIATIQASMDKIVATANTLASTVFTEEEQEFAGDFSIVGVSHDLAKFLKQSQIRLILKMAQGVSPQYRQVITGLMRMRALGKLKPSDAVAARGALYQQQFLAIADAISLAMILQTNGLPFKFVTDIMALPETVTMIMLMGSDRQEKLR